MENTEKMPVGVFLGKYITLDKLDIGVDAVIKNVGGTGALRRRLLDMGLTPKTKVRIRKTAPMGDPIEITLRGYELTLRKEDAKEITVEKESDKGGAVK